MMRFNRSALFCLLSLPCVSHLNQLYVKVHKNPTEPSHNQTKGL